ncbi:unnamed protein product [Dibothriocephalus latus]|uniref:PAS domain-containing protein n=1 Tax=Dibothriocephalus latus TaxID=60516 RepID=A0A3P7NKP8_DIBLA|nr:unnamed protein product [Dibothriocephalus latus]
MPVRRGHVAPRNTYIDALIKKFDNKYAAFIIANSNIFCSPIIFCSADFCSLFSYSKAQLLLKPANHLKRCELSIAPLKDEFGHVPLHIIFFEECDLVNADCEHESYDICKEPQKFSTITNVLFHRGRGSSSSIRRASQKIVRALSVHHDTLPKPPDLERRSSEHVLGRSNHKAAIVSLFGQESLPSFPLEVDFDAKTCVPFLVKMSGVTTLMPFGDRILPARRYCVPQPTEGQRTVS